MIDNFMFSFNAVAPMFVIICLGYWLKTKSVLTTEARDKLIYLVFNIALPMLIIRDIAGQNLADTINPSMIGFTVAAVSAGFILAWVVAVLLIKERGSKGSFVQCSFRGNYAVMGLGLIENTMGEASPTAVVMLIFMIAIYNSLSVFILTYYSDHTAHGIQLVKIIFYSMAKNPLIISMLIAVVLSLINFSTPHILAVPMHHLAQTSMPLALLSLGASINISEFKNQLGIASLATAIKLIFMPLFACIVAVMLGMRGEYLLIVLIATGSPTAVAGYVMARQMGTDAPLAANIVVLTTLFSIVSFTLFLFHFVTLGLI